MCAKSILAQFLIVTEQMQVWQCLGVLNLQPESRLGAVTSPPDTQKFKAGSNRREEVSQFSSDQ